MATTPVTLGQIAAKLGIAAPPAAAGLVITGVASLADAGASEITFLSSETHLKEFAKTRAAAVVVQDNVKFADAATPPPAIVLRAKDADLAIAVVLEMFALPIARPPLGIDPLARIAASSQIASGAAVGPFASIGNRVRIGANAVIHPGVQIYDDVVLGNNVELFANVVIRERITIGNRVTIHAGSVLGTDGFGYRWDGQKHAKVPQIGTVIIEDDVEIGSCVCIDRAKFSATVVGRGSKIDNLVQVGHNVTIGPHCIVVGQTGLAGSSSLGTLVLVGGQVAVRDHVSIGDMAKIAACAAVADDVPAKEIYSGVPALPHRQSLREQAALRHLPELRPLIRKLQDEIAQLNEKVQKLSEAGG